jgi:Zn-dependent protease with chaperone function
MMAAGPNPEELTAWVRDLAGRLGTTTPDVVIGNVPAWSSGAVLSLKTTAGLAGPGGRRSAALLPGGPLPVLTVDPQRLAGLPAPVARACLAHPIAQFALGQPRRRKNRTTLAAVLAGGLAIAALAALSWPLPAWAAAIALAVCAAVLVDLFTIRCFLYEADRRVTDVLGAGATAAFLEHLRAQPPQLTGWVSVAARTLPSPSRRARKLAGGSGRQG